MLKSIILFTSYTIKRSIYRSLLPCLYIILLLSCSKKRESFKISNEKIITFGSYNVNQSIYFPEKYIQEITYIPLKRNFNKEYFASINKMKFINGNIFIMDRVKKILSVFDESGEFLQHVGFNDTGPSDYVIISDFDVDSNGFVYLFDGFRDKDRLLIYNSNFELERIEELTFEADVIKVGNEETLFFGLPSWNFGDFEGKKMLITDHEIRNATPFLDYDKEIIETIKIDYQFGRWKDMIYYNKPIDNRVYVFDEEGNYKQVLEFDFGILNVPRGLRHNLEENYEELKYFRYLQNFLVGFDEGYLGSLYDQGAYRVFLIDTIENQIFLGRQSDYYEFLGQFVGFDDGYALSYLDPEYIGEERMEDLPEWVKDHLKGDEFVIRLVKF